MGEELLCIVKYLFRHSAHFMTLTNSTNNSMAHPERTDMFTTETVLVSEKDEKTLVQTSSASVSSMDDASSVQRSTKKRSIADLRRGFQEGARNTAVSLRRPDMLAKKAGKNTWRVLKNYAKFVGPGFMVRLSIASYYHHVFQN